VPLGGELLEPAAGTGYWTEHFARQGCRVTAIDAAPRMLDLNRARIMAAGLQESVTYHCRDIFLWQPERPYDGIFLGYWLSHIPANLLDGFLKRMHWAVCPGGFMLILDSNPGARYAPWHGTETVDTEQELRSLANGETYRVVKRHMLPNELISRLKRAGFSARIDCTPEFFMHAIAHKV
jgi:2-polyprenyl-3-methyl-5-hydroxy-6-metoxy-1,4-benzoquinol methylase